MELGWWGGGGKDLQGFGERKGQTFHGYQRSKYIKVWLLLSPILDPIVLLYPGTITGKVALRMCENSDGMKAKTLMIFLLQEPKQLEIQRIIEPTLFIYICCISIQDCDSELQKQMRQEEKFSNVALDSTLFKFLYVKRQHYNTFADFNWLLFANIVLQNETCILMFFRLKQTLLEGWEKLIIPGNKHKVYNALGIHKVQVLSPRLYVMSFFLIIAAITMTAEVTLGSFANVFIVLVNFTDCIKRRKISLADRILTALAIFRICLLWVILINWCSTVFSPASLTKQVRFIICVAWAVTNHFHTWLAALLSILYLLKIGNFPNRIFLGLKGKIKSVIVVVLLGSLVLLFLNLTMMTMGKKVQVNGHRGNMTEKTKVAYAVNLIVVTAFTLNNVIPFTISMICFLLLIYSLCKHLKTMKLYGKGSHNPGTMAHIKALQAVVSFLLLFAMFILSLIVSGYSYVKPLDEPVHLICQVIGTLYPSSHSYILIWGNKKIKQAFVLAMVQVRARLWLKERKP
ncbi:taste receptor type 2 member [Cricetulus griseus]|uniref:Taste receptor type 2 member n=1 Tax=Cricetulus griseus TaxID=10029 RepID=A0A061HWZ8_CRIGR|nr:taste receptor type 2 member [Cricetulus griseus]